MPKAIKYRSNLDRYPHVWIFNERDAQISVRAMFNLQCNTFPHSSQLFPWGINTKRTVFSSTSAGAKFSVHTRYHKAVILPDTRPVYQPIQLVLPYCLLSSACQPENIFPSKGRRSLLFLGGIRGSLNTGHNVFYTQEHQLIGGQPTGKILHKHSLDYTNTDKQSWALAHLGTLWGASISIFGDMQVAAFF